MQIEFQLELNRRWLHREDEDEPYGEMNFVIKTDYFLSIFPLLFGGIDEDVDSFLDVYEPETDGEKIYQQAKLDNAIIEEFITEADTNEERESGVLVSFQIAMG